MILLIFIFLFSISVVSAEEIVDETNGLTVDNDMSIANEEIAVEHDGMLGADSDSEIISANKEWYVNGSKANDGKGTIDSPFNNLESAINNVGDGQTIMIASGTYSGDKNKNFQISKNNVSFVSYGDGNAIFDGQNDGYFAYVNNSANLKGLTFANYAMGAISMGSGVVSDCIFLNNTVNYLFNDTAYYIFINNMARVLSNDELNVFNDTVTFSSAISMGSGVVSGCVFSNNVAKYLFNYTAKYIINGTETSIFNDSAIFASTIAMVSGNVSDCVFSNNSAKYFFNNTIDNISNSTVFHVFKNMLIFGGDIAAVSGNVCGCNFSSNPVKYLFQDTVSDVKSTRVFHVFNDTVIFGGGIAMVSGNIADCIFSNNDITYDFYFTTTEIVFNDSVGFGGDVVMVSGNVGSCIFSNNSVTYLFENYAHLLDYGAATFGGAISVGSGVVSDCNFSNNAATCITIDTSAHLYNNTATFGGAISMGSGVVSDCIFSNNSAISGGAVSMGSGVVSDCIFSKNNAVYGGAVYTDVSLSVENDMEINNCNFTNNAAYCGGSIYLDKINYNISNCMFIDSNASLIGGAVYSWDTKSKIKDSSFINCRSQYGGAIITLYSNLNLNNIVFANCSAFAFGGAIYKKYGKLICTGSEFSNNYAYYDGGAVYLSHSQSSISSNIYNTSFNDNYAIYGGGAIHSLSDIVILDDFTNSMINSDSNFNGFVETNYLNSFLDLGNYTMVVANTSNYDGNLPSHFSLVENGWDTFVKNQGMLPTCWSYANIATIETALLKATGVSYDLSEGNFKNIIAKYSDYGVNRRPNSGSSSAVYAFGYFSGGFGPVLETEDPTSVSGFSPILRNSFLIDNFGIAAKPKFLDNNEVEIREIKEAVIKYGAVRVGITFKSDNNTTDGIHFYNPNSGANHAVAIVGWDDTIPAEYFPNNCPGDGAWIVKNSWGTNSGINGYRYVSYYDKSIATGSNYYIVFNNTIRYNRIYQYDYFKVDYCSTKSANSWYKNIYTSVSNEDLCAFSTYFDDSIAWESSVYVNGELKHTQNGKSPGKGYYTFNFDKAIPVFKGDEITIVLKVNSEKIPYTDKTKVNTLPCGEGVSFSSVDGKKWTDMDKKVACLKLFTQFRYGSSISIQPVGDAFYGDSVLVNFDVENITTINYILKNSNGDTISTGNNVTSNSIEFSNLGVDNYTLTLINENGTYDGCSASATFSVLPASSLITINPIGEIVYGNTINVSFNVLNRTNVSYSVITKKGDKIIDYASVESNVIVLPALDVDDYIITIDNSGSVNYAGDVKSADFSVIKAEPVMIVLANPISVGEDAIIVIGGLADATGNVTAAVNGKTYVALVKDGNVTIIIPDLAAGNYKVPVTYSGNGNYNSVTKEVNIAVEGNESVIITALDVTKYFKGSERFVVSVSDNQGNPLANKTVTININGATYTRVTDANGSAGIALGLNSGVYNVKSAVGNDSVNSVVTILSTVNGTDVVKMFRNDTQYYATFLDSKGNFLADGTTVQFNINGVMYDRKVSGDKGQAKLNINLNQGTYVITAMNPVTGEKAANSITVLAKLTENKDVTKYYRNGTQYAVKVVGEDGKTVGAGKTVKFNINGVFYERTTNESGIAKLNLNLQPGDYIITAEYEGCMVSNNITILPVLNATDISMKYRDGTQFKANLVDGQGKPYAGQNVTFNINGVFYNRLTDSSGQAKLNINLLPGEYIITSSYDGANIANKITVESWD